MPEHSLQVITTQERTYFRPHPLLQGTISHYTLYIPPQNSSGSIHIVPDASGCIVCRYNGSHLETLFWGPSSHVVTVGNTPENYSLYWMVEFLPGGANHLLGIPMSLLRDARLPLEAVDPILARKIDEIFSSHGIDPFYGMPKGFNDVFIRKIRHTSLCQTSLGILDQIKQTQGTRKVKELVCSSGYSERHLNRILQEHVGLNLKLLTRIVRINVACQRMCNQRLPLVMLAHSLQYHDQSHFIHDFKAICGVTPSAYLQGMSDFYNEDLKYGATLPVK